MARSWYAYKGVNYPIDMLSSFSLIDGVPACSDGNELCAIYTQAGDNNPTLISDNLQRYISNGLAKFIAQPDTPNAKLFVVFKFPS